MKLRLNKQSKELSIAKSIRGLLIAGLFVSCALIIIIAITAWESLSNLQNKIEELVEESSVKTSLLYDMRIAARERNGHLVMILLRDDAFEIDDEWMSFRNQGSDFLIAREKIIALGLDEKESRLLEKQRLMSIDAVELQYDIYAHIMNNDRASALRVFNKHMEVQRKVFQSLDLLLQLQKIKNNSKVEETRHSSISSIQTVWTSSAIIIFIIFVTTMYIIKRLSQQFLHIENERMKFKALIEGSMDAVLVLDGEKITDCNVNLLTQFCVDSLAEFNAIGLEYFSGFSDDNNIEKSKGIFCALNHVLADSRREYQWNFIKASGEKFPADVEVTGIEIQQKPYIQMVIRDVTEREKFQNDLRDANENLEHKVLERTEELKDLNSKIAEIARSAGMAEVASGVLHNVGNVLNSINVSTSILIDQVHNCKSDRLEKLVDLLDEHKDNLAEFIAGNKKGKLIVPFIKELSNQLAIDQEKQVEELKDLSSNVDHIKNIISMQQSYTGSRGVTEKHSAVTVFEDAIKINIASMKRHNIILKREFDEGVMLCVDKHRLIQVLVNLISNAMHAVEHNQNFEKEVIVGVSSGNGNVIFSVQDNGVGIEKNTLNRLFEFGFKKREGGHGYGLHHSALVAGEMEGRLAAESEGAGQGARFVLELPVK